MSELGPKWLRPFDLLRKKWEEIPVGNERRRTPDLIALSDEELWQCWIAARHQLAVADFTRRGWHHCLYRDVLRGKRVLDVGSGFGIDGITFAQAGALVTFLDIAEINLTVLRRLCRYQNVPGDFFYLADTESLSALPENYDVIWCNGSLITTPFEIAREEARALLAHLTPDGRWIELAYPRARWEREGRLPFDVWGEKTDGGAPWIEWYDLEKMLARLAPAQFKIVLHFQFHNDDFIWFDLLRVPEIG